MPGSSEDDLEPGESEFGSFDELSSPDEPKHPGHHLHHNTSNPQHHDNTTRTSMPPPSTLVMQPMPQPMLAPSQLIQPQMLQHM